MRRTSLLIGVVAVGALLAVPAAAKEGVRAKLEDPVRLDSAPGTMLRVTWRLADEEGHPFGASGIYLRVSRCRGKPLNVAAAARRDGTYSARFRVPRRGIRRLVVGLEGIRIVGGRSERADVFFRFDPPLARRCSR